MNLVVLGYRNPLTAHVFGAIHEQHPISALIDVQWQPAPTRSSRLGRLCKSPVATLQQRLDQRVDNWHHRRQMEQISAYLTDTPTSLQGVPTFSIGSRELHTPAALDLFSSLAPDILLVTHAPLMKPVLYQLPSIATLNIHWGIAPHYCGQHTLFWPLYSRDYRNLGITIHRIDEGIDTGPTLAQGFPRLEPGDDESTIYGRCAHVASELANGILAAAEAGNPLSGKKLPGTPRMFRRSNRHAHHSLFYWARRKLLGEQLPALPTRRQLYYESAVPASLLTV